MITDDEGLKNILLNTRVVASVGVSSNEDKPSYWIFNYLMNNGYEMIPVNPTASEVQGLKSFPDLKSISNKVDVVQVFRKPEDVPGVVQAAIQIGAKVVWMQVGVVNHEAANQAEAAGLIVVMDKCMRDTHRRLLGGNLSL
jgi:predicted CoA-binding protein